MMLTYMEKKFLEVENALFRTEADLREVQQKLYDTKEYVRILESERVDMSERYHETLRKLTNVEKQLEEVNLLLRKKDAEIESLLNKEADKTTSDLDKALAKLVQRELEKNGYGW